MPVLEHVYENGLRLRVIEWPGEHRVASKIFTDMGTIMRRFFSKRWVKATGAVIAFLAVLFLAGYGTFKWLYDPSVPEADFAEPASQVEAYSQDLDYLELYAELEKAFEDEGKREAFRQHIASLRSQLDTMTPERFEVGVAQAIAIGDNAHSNVSPLGMSRRVNHFPVRTGPFEDGEFIIQARRGYEHLLGAEIIAVEGHPISEVTASFVSLFGGPENRARFFTHVYINSPALLHGQGFTATPDGAELSLKLANGETRDVYLEGTMLPDDRRSPFGREVMDYRVPEHDEGEWLHLMADREPPLYLAQPDEPFLYRYLDGPNGAYVKINYNYDVDGRSLKGWLREVASYMRSRQPDFAVVDLRFNGGGTDATNRFAEALPSLVGNDGPVYIVTSRETFSAGIGAAAQIKKFAGDRARIVGGTVGDRLRFIANGGTLFRLPNSGISARVWATFEDYADGCWDWSECFVFSPFFRTAGVGDLDPHVAIPTNFVDYASNRDAVLDTILAEVAGL